MYDVAIIGAGVTGGMLARTLAAYELDICILEKENDVAMGTSRANSGIVHAGYDAENGTLKARLNVRGSEMMEEIAGQLGVPYSRNGSLVAGFHEEDTETIRALYHRGVKNGVKQLRILDGKEARQLEPGLSEAVTCALYAPTCAIICPYELTVAAVGNAMDNGAELLLNFHTAQIARRDGYYEIAEKDSVTGRRIRAKYVINAAGLHADEVAGLAGDNSVRIRPRRGEYLLLDRECGGLVSPIPYSAPPPKRERASWPRLPWTATSSSAPPPRIWMTRQIRPPPQRAWHRLRNTPMKR